MNNGDKIRKKFKPGFRGIVHNSGGWKELLWTKFNFWSVTISVIIFFCYQFQINTVNESLKIIDTLTSSAISLLGGIVGLSLAGLTLIITFSSPEVIEKSVSKQLDDFKETGDFTASYFQKAIAKFSFIVFIQLISLLVFFLLSIFRNLNITSSPFVAFWTNSLVFFLSVYLMIFSLVLVLASIVNLFTFSQTSNFMDFMKKMKDESED